MRVSSGWEGQYGLRATQAPLSATWQKCDSWNNLCYLPHNMPCSWAVSQHVWSDCSGASSRCSGHWFRLMGLYHFVLWGYSESSSVKCNNFPKTLVSWTEQLRAALCTLCLQTELAEGTCPNCQGVQADAVQLHCWRSWPTALSPAQDWHSTWARCQQGDRIAAGDLAPVQPGWSAGRAGMPRSARLCADKPSCTQLSRMWTSAPSGTVSILHVEQNRGIS